MSWAQVSTKTKRMHGRVVMIYKPGELIMGYMNNGSWQGNCRQICNDPWPGQIYVGQWKNHKRNGYGVCTYSDGAVYKGHWKDHLRHDTNGCYAWPSGAKYEGPYVNDCQEGEAKYTFDDGSVRRGVFSKGKKT